MDAKHSGLLPRPAAAAAPSRTRQKPLTGLPVPTRLPRASKQAHASGTWLPSYVESRAPCPCHLWGASKAMTPETFSAATGCQAGKRKGLLMVSVIPQRHLLSLRSSAAPGSAVPPDGSKRTFQAREGIPSLPGLPHQMASLRDSWESHQAQTPGYIESCSVPGKHRGAPAPLPAFHDFFVQLSWTVTTPDPQTCPRNLCHCRDPMEFWDLRPNPVRGSWSLCSHGLFTPLTPSWGQGPGAPPRCPM